MRAPPTEFQPSDILNTAIEAAQPTRTQHDAAVSAYENVAKWLASDGDLASLKPTVRPQGSFLLRTAVRPMSCHEFDLDLVLTLQIKPTDMSSDDAAELVRARLEQHKDLAKRLDLDRFPKCIRLTYANDFHLDVVVACPVEHDQPKIWIPASTADRADSSIAATWKLTDPWGYAEDFEARNTINESIRLSKSVAPAPGYEPATKKSALRKHVQLIKMRRNQHYKPEDAPTSILLTTMVSTKYQGRPFTAEALRDIVLQMAGWIDAQGASLDVPNPTIPSENFAQTLSFQQRRELSGFLGLFANELATLTKPVGIDKHGERLNEMFGNNVGNTALKSFARRVGNAKASNRLGTGTRTAGALGVTAAGATASARPNPSHEFYGE